MNNTNFTPKRIGVMLDCSRNAVMTVNSLKRFIDLMAKIGYNFLELYTEDTYELPNEPYFGYLRGRYTQDELKEIDGYARSKGVELIPCVQTLAHYNAIARHPAYDDIIDCNDILLCDEPKTYELIEKIFAHLSKTFTSRQVNIGMDEAHNLGLGKHLTKHGYQTRYEILTRHLKKVSAIAEKYGFTAHMWSDMFFRINNNGDYYADGSPLAQEILNDIPSNVQLTYWDYYHQDKDLYDKMFKAHNSTNKPVWFAGGAWCWNGFAPMHEFSLKTMKPALKSALKHKVENVLVTMWGDNGKECSFFSMPHTLFTLFNYAIGNFDDKNIITQFNEKFNLKYKDFCLLDLPNAYEKGKSVDRVINPCKSLLFQDLFLGLYDKKVATTYISDYSEYAKKLKSVIKRNGEYGYIFEALSDLCNALSIKIELGAKTRKYYKENQKSYLQALVGDYDKLVKYLKKFHSSFYNLWHKENKPFGWEVQDARLGGLIQRVTTCKQRLTDYLNGKLANIPELEEEILDYGEVQNNLYHNIISTSSTANT